MPDKADGLKNRIDWALVGWIIRYKNHEMRERVLKHKNAKQVYILRSNKEIDSLVERLKNDF